MSLLAKRYARALFEAAREKSAAEAVERDLAAIEHAFADAGVRALVLDPETPRSDRRSALGKIVHGGHELTRNLIEVLLQRRREAVLPELHVTYAALVREMRGEIEGVVETARPLGDDQLSALERSATGLVGKKVTLRARIVPELIGGVRLRVGNRLYDGSVKTALEDLERRLMEAPIP